MLWKDEREPTIKYCMRRQIDVVQKFTRIQSFGHNWWWANGIQVKYLPRIRHIAPLQQSPRVPVKNERKAKMISLDGIVFKSMFNDMSWESEDNEWEWNANADLVSIYAGRFSAGDWSFLGPGSAKKWYYTTEYNPQGEWDRVAEQMMLTFAESKYPVFRSTRPLSRGVLKSKGAGKLSTHFCADGETVDFRTIISVNQLSIYGAVSDMCEECNSCHDERGNLLWQDNLTHCSCQVWWRHIPLTDDLALEKIFCKSTKNELKSYHNKTEW